LGKPNCITGLILFPFFFFLSWVANTELNRWTEAGGEHPMNHTVPNKLSKTVADQAIFLSPPAPFFLRGSVEFIPIYFEGHGGLQARQAFFVFFLFV